MTNRRIAANSPLGGQAGAIVVRDGWIEGARDPRSDRSCDRLAVKATGCEPLHDRPLLPLVDAPSTCLRVGKYRRARKSDSRSLNGLEVFHGRLPQGVSQR
jgi:hypothetical protein